jgi:hypothetical protein
VSDPVRALPMAPRVSGGVAHATTAGVSVAVREVAVRIRARTDCA